MPAGSETSEKSSSELSAKGSLNSKADDDDSNQKQNSVQLCTEVFDEHSSPTEDETLEYARKIGINVEKESQLIYLAREGLLRELPSEWKPCWDETIGDYYYFNSDTGSTQWAHPLDEIYKQKVTLAREQFNNAEDKNQNNIVTDSNVAVSSDGDTSDVLSKSKMDKPLKLGPLPPLGGGKSSGAAGLKKLAPLRKSPSLKLQSSSEKSSIDSPNRRSNASPAPKISEKTPSSSSLSPPKGSLEPKGLSLKLGGRGSSFLKSEAGKESIHSDDESTSVPIKIIGQVEASNENVKSILKPSPTRSAINTSNNISSNSQGNLRAAMIARDEKRIQFNIKEDSKNIVITTDDDDEDETSSAAIDEIKPKKDFMERHSLLFDASELTATTSTTPATSTANSGQEGSPLPDSVEAPLSESEQSQIEEGIEEDESENEKSLDHSSDDPPQAGQIQEKQEKNDDDNENSSEKSKVNKLVENETAAVMKDRRLARTPSSGSDHSSGTARSTNLALTRPPGSVPKNSRPVSARNLSATLKKDTAIKLSSASSSSSDSIEDNDMVLQNVKFKTETLNKMQAKKQELTETPSKINFNDVRRNSASQPTGLTHLVGNPINKESLTAQITESVKQKHDEEIRQLHEKFAKEKEYFEREKQHQEKMLKDMFHAEMDSLKSKLENNFENQKKILVTEFNDRLVLEKKELKAEHEKQLIAKDELLKSDIESLRKEFEIKKKELESNLRSQFTQDITELRAELERAREDSKEKNYHSSRNSPSISAETNTKPHQNSTRAKSSKSNSSSRSPMVLKEIEGLESDIEKLRSQVQKGSRMIVESDDSTEDEFVPHQAYESRIQRVHQQHHVPMTHFDHHANDLTQTLQALQERVNTLERNLMPFTVPYPTVPAFNPYGTHIPNTHGSPQPTMPVPVTPTYSAPRVVNGWTVDEQIYKSKQWLKQRNQQMFPPSRGGGHMT